MDINTAALTLLCLGFSAGFLLVVSFLERPILPLVTAPHETQENESDVRWIHAQIQAFVGFVGANIMLPVMLIALITAVAQMIERQFDVVSVFLSVGLGVLFFITTILTGPAMRRVRDTAAYDEGLEEVSAALFRLVRLHHNMLLALIPLILAQLALLFY